MKKLCENLTVIIIKTPRRGLAISLLLVCGLFVEVSVDNGQCGNGDTSQQEQREGIN